MTTKPKSELTRVFHDPETDPASLPSIIEFGVEYVPFTSHRISPELAAHRRNLNTQGADWSDRACTIGLHVTYRPANSLSIRALGRL